MGENINIINRLVISRFLPDGADVFQEVWKQLKLLLQFLLMLIIDLVLQSSNTGRNEKNGELTFSFVDFFNFAISPLHEKTIDFLCEKCYNINYNVYVHIRRLRPP